ncbi:unnamed protein product, partial [marine sediment metagenome]
ALKESQHFIESVFESIQDGISVLAPDLTIRHVNNLMKEWYAENLPLEGKKCYEVYQNRKRPCDPCPTLRCMKSGKTERDIVPGLPGSAVEWIELFSYPMKDPETGKINGAVEFGRNITARKKAEEGLKESKELFSAFMDYLPAIVFVKDEDSRTKFMNKHMRDVLGADDSWIDHTVLEIFGDTDLARKMIEDDRKALSAGFELKEESVYGADGTERLYETQKFRIGRKDKPPLLGGIALDITDRKQAEEKIKASLKEKEVMLQEIHHRVKNNMQIIVSLLRLQSYAAKDKKIDDMFKVAQNRIRSMAIIHEKLYLSKDFASIDFAYYIRSLTTYLMQTYQIDPKQITFKTDVKDIHLDINQGVPVGLLINELVSNALKHAFPKGKKGEIIVKFHADKKNKKTLIVSDNGIGHPDKVDMSKPETLGLQLIKDLTKQIEGKLDLDNKAGTTFKITFT